jgi:hypothetical protein
MNNGSRGGAFGGDNEQVLYTAPDVASNRAAGGGAASDEQVLYTAPDVAVNRAAGGAAANDEQVVYTAPDVAGANRVGGGAAAASDEQVVYTNDQVVYTAPDVAVQRSTPVDDSQMLYTPVESGGAPALAPKLGGGGGGGSRASDKRTSGGDTRSAPALGTHGTQRTKPNTHHVNDGGDDTKARDLSEARQMQLDLRRSRNKSSTDTDEPTTATDDAPPALAPKQGVSAKKSKVRRRFCSCLPCCAIAFPFLLCFPILNFLCCLRA